MNRFALAAAAALVVCAVAFDAQAFPGGVGVAETRYPNATNLHDCGLCHASFDGSSAALNPYGSAVLTALGGGFDFDQAMADIEGDDSDNDGSTNLEEIDTGAGFEPGWTCDTYLDAIAAPGDLADFVDPIDPGCDGVTTTTLGGTTTTIVTTTIVTTTTSLESTTTLPTTTTTLPGEPKCSQPLTSGPEPVATDCLYILQAAVGSVTCSPACICAPTGELPPQATDALLCLNVAVGQEFPLDCPCDVVTTTTLGGTTTTTLGGGTTTTTTGGGTTTTTTGGGTTTTTTGGGTTTTTTGGATTTTTSTTLPPM